MKINQIAKKQEEYYYSLLQKHGAGVNAVASGDQLYKDLRYKKLSKVFGDETDFSIHDVGFGLGHYYEYLKKNHDNKNFRYSGSEVTKSFVDYCKNKYPNNDFYLRDIASKSFNDNYDFLVFGGTFYHKVDIENDVFERFIEIIIKNAFDMSVKGIAFNSITEYVDYKYPDLYYANIDVLLNYIVKNLSRFFFH
jgi:hypothetical protein